MTSRDPCHFEFFGPYLGPTGIVFGLPIVCYILAFLICSLDTMELRFLWDTTVWSSLFGFETVLGYLCLVAALHILLPAKAVQGTLLSNKKRLNYRLNGVIDFQQLHCMTQQISLLSGLLVFLLIYSSVFYFTFVSKTLQLSVVHDQWIPCLTASVAVSMGLSLWLYFHSFRPDVLLARGGRTGYQWYDMFIGRELNPRLGLLDLKEFCELYPGLLGWTLLNLSNCHKQLQSFGHITNSMILINVFHLIYVIDALYYEPSILTTMDITNDGFGFMLVFGDLTWVPFIYSLQSKYLAHNPIELSNGYLVMNVVLNGLGYWIFRGANSQKDRFRRDPQHPSVADLKVLKTSTGRNLIISSWWGLARHINYTGDWLLGLSWCLTCGHASPIPYFYAIYFGILLVHRDRRDYGSCKEKYGKDWDRYCSFVPYRFIPYVY